jgi:hypothetical protein
MIMLLYDQAQLGPQAAKAQDFCAQAIDRGGK